MKAREKHATGAAVGVGDGAVAREAALIALDWGTTLRAYLFDAAGKVIATRVSTAGIMNLPVPAEEGGFDAAFDEACGVWLREAPALPTKPAPRTGSAVAIRLQASVDVSRSVPHVRTYHRQGDLPGRARPHRDGPHLTDRELVRWRAVLTVPTGDTGARTPTG